MDIACIRSMFPALSRKVYGKDLVYFDNAATSQRVQSVIDEWNRINAESNANIHRAVHRLADEATQAYEQARDAVKDFLNVRTGKAAETRVRIISSSGKAVYDESSVISAFEPASIDMSGCAPGMYEVIVEIGNDRTERTIAKI